MTSLLQIQIQEPLREDGRFNLHLKSRSYSNTIIVPYFNVFTFQVQYEKTGLQPEEQGSPIPTLLFKRCTFLWRYPARNYRLPVKPLESLHTKKKKINFYFQHKNPSFIQLDNTLLSIIQRSKIRCTGFHNFLDPMFSWYRRAFYHFS